MLIQYFLFIKNVCKAKSPALISLLVCMQIFSINAQEIKGEPSYFLSGNQKRRDGDYFGAILDYNKAIQRNPDNHILYSNRGVIYYELKQYQNAIRDYTKALSLNRNYQDAYFNRGNARRRAKNFIQSIDDYSKVLALNPNDFEAYK